jgi:hypothetical protein
MNKQDEYNNDNESINSLGNTSNSDNCNENGKREKKTRNRPSKAERFVEEREELILRLNEIIGLNKTNKIILYDLEQNERIKTYLKENISLIKKIFKTCTWGYFSNDIKKGMGNEIGLLRAIYKNEGWEISSKRKICERENEKKLYIELHFNK